ncbi:hypothetical protein GOP47_0023785 [Adiantum capillus-veneris]|uniref:Arf-GAP domain-containing protein n=1 Tax=Adiantum capillus-veneris TaxID=13818 RepID=A0A9D4U4M7_ADICA|nr:hypothetical protein GOP47_0023785 [Adiantum capillus-veneris]
MGSRLKEDEKNEKAIRALLRKTPNRRCINCNSMGPQYVCLNFWTFVCTQCSGIHREFTHRVKSVSMSKFTSQEVANLEAGGNERGRETFFKDWDSQRQPLPDSNNVDRLREFIKMVYVEKRFSGEKPLPRNRGGDREEIYDRRPEPRPNYRADSRSPPYEDRYDDRGRRSNAGYEDRRPEERGARFDEKRSPARFESDRSRYERNYNDGRRYDERPRYESRDRQPYDDRYNEGLDRRFEDRFANDKVSRGYGSSSPPPPIRPVKEILGEDVPPLRVENHGSQVNGGRDGSQDGRGQRFGSSSSFGSVDGNIPAVAPVVKREDSTSLIDFSAEPDPPAPKEQSDPFGLTVAQSAADNSNSTGWATFEPAAPAPSLGASAQVPAVPSIQGLLGGFTNSPLGAAAQAPAASPVQSLLGGFANPTNVGNGNIQWAAQWTAPGAPSVDASTNSWSSLAGPSAPTMSSQPWNAFSTTGSETSSLPVPQGSRPLDSQIASNSTPAAAQVVQAQPSGRKELPEDIFGRSISSVHFPGGQSFTTQYPPMDGMGLMPSGSYGQPQKSSNPFDLPGDSGAGQISGEFPSLSSMHAALPTFNMGPRPAPGPGFGAYGPQWSQPNVMNPPQVLWNSASIPSEGGPFFSQQPQAVLPQGMQGTLGSSLGVNMPRTSLGINVPGSFPSNHNPKHGAEPFFSAPIQSLPSQNSFGGADSMFTAHGAPGQFSHQNPVGPGALGNFASTDSFLAGSVGQHRLLSQSSLGSLSGPGIWALASLS